MANRTDLTASGFVDDMFLEQATLEINRTGVARYSFTATTTDGAISLEIWTTVKTRISVRLDENIGAHSWFVLRTDREIFESLTAKDCAVHLEQLDRGHYFLGLYRGPDEVRLHLDAPRYIKARPVDKRGHLTVNQRPSCLPGRPVPYNPAGFRFLRGDGHAQSPGISAYSLSDLLRRSR